MKKLPLIILILFLFILLLPVPKREEKKSPKELFLELIEKRREIKEMHVKKEVKGCMNALIEIWKKDGKERVKVEQGGEVQDFILSDLGLKVCSKDFCILFRDSGIGKTFTEVMRGFEELFLKYLERADVNLLGHDEVASRECLKFFVSYWMGYRKVEQEMCVDKASGLVLWLKDLNTGHEERVILLEEKVSDQAFLEHLKVYEVKRPESHGFTLVNVMHQLVDDGLTLTVVPLVSGTNLKVEVPNSECKGTFTHFTAFSPLRLECNFENEIGAFEDYNIMLVVELDGRVERGWIWGTKISLRP